MKKISVNLLINVVFVLAGIIFLLYSRATDFTEWLSRVMGVLFVLPALAYVVGVLWRRKSITGGLPWLGLTPAVGGACFGILMIIKAEMFTGVIELLMGVLLLALGLFHVFFLLISRHDLMVKAWHYVAPVLLVAAGVGILLADGLREHVVLLSGVGMLLFAFTSVVEHFARVKNVSQTGNTSNSTTSSESIALGERTEEPQQHANPIAENEP